MSAVLPTGLAANIDATGGRDAYGFGGGLYGGYNMQSGQIVYGAEADINYGDNDTRSPTRKMEQGVNGSVRARVGYDLNPVLVYGTAGVAASSVKATQAGGSDKKTLLGWTVGAGVKPWSPTTSRRASNIATPTTASRTSTCRAATFRRATTNTAFSVGMGVKF